MRRYRSVWEMQMRHPNADELDRARLAAHPEFHSLEREKRIQQVKRGGKHTSGTRRPVSLAKVNLSEEA